MQGALEPAALVRMLEYVLAQQPSIQATFPIEDPPAEMLGDRLEGGLSQLDDLARGNIGVDNGDAERAKPVGNG